MTDNPNYGRHFNDSPPCNQTDFTDTLRQFENQFKHQREQEMDQYWSTHKLGPADLPTLTLGTLEPNKNFEKSHNSIEYGHFDFEASGYTKFPLDKGSTLLPTGDKLSADSLIMPNGDKILFSPAGCKLESTHPAHSYTFGDYTYINYPNL